MAGGGGGREGRDQPTLRQASDCSLASALSAMQVIHKFIRMDGLWPVARPN